MTQKETKELKVTERPLPPRYRHMLELQLFRKLRWTERLRIFLGFNLTIDLKVGMEHKVGRYQVVQGDVTVVNQLAAFDEKL